MTKPADMVRWYFSVVIPHAFLTLKLHEKTLQEMPILPFGRFGHFGKDSHASPFYRFPVYSQWGNVKCIFGIFPADSPWVLTRKSRFFMDF